MDHLHGSAEVPTLAQDLHNACRFLFLRPPDIPSPIVLTMAQQKGYRDSVPGLLLEILQQGKQHGDELILGPSTGPLRLHRGTPSSTGYRQRTGGGAHEWLLTVHIFR